MLGGVCVLVVPFFIGRVRSALVLHLDVGVQTVLRTQLDDARQKLDSLETMTARQSEELADMEGMFQGLSQRITSLRVAALPPELNAKLTRLRDSHPDLLSFDDDAGAAGGPSVAAAPPPPPGAPPPPPGAPHSPPHQPPPAGPVRGGSGVAVATGAASSAPPPPPAQPPPPPVSDAAV